jgi:hypothetical protein
LLGKETGRAVCGHLAATLGESPPPFLLQHGQQDEQTTQRKAGGIGPRGWTLQESPVQLIAQFVLGRLRVVIHPRSSVSSDFSLRTHIRVSINAPAFPGHKQPLTREH